MIQIATSLCLLIISYCSPACAQGTAFTYQGRLDNGGSPANGSYDLTFIVWNAASGGAQAGNTLTNMNTAVSNGLFTVTLDFGAGGVFGGPDRWLEIGVRTSGSGAFTTLVPRQRVTASPYAIAAGTVTGVISSGGLQGTYSGALTLDNAANSFSGDGAALTSLNASALTSGTIPTGALSNAWKIGGNTGATPGTHFLGTTDNQPLELRVNNLRALRLEPTASNDTVNVVGGSPRNFVAPGVVGATIGGGGTGSYLGSAYSNSVLADFGFIGSGLRNRIASGATSGVIAGGEANDLGTGATYGFIGAGFNNNIGASSSESTIAGGGINDIGFNSSFSAIGGGSDNNIGDGASSSVIAGGLGNDIAANSIRSTIGGGRENNIAGNSSYSVIAGGESNNVTANASYAVIPGGRNNSATNYAFAAGRRARANHMGAFVWADSQDVDFPSTATNQFSLRASGGVRLVTGGAGMTLDGQSVLSGTVTTAQLADGATLGELLDDDGAGSGLDADLIDGLNSTAFAQAAHTHAGADIVSGTVADARIAATIARDSEILPAVLAGDGAGSGLDADLLDGLSSAAFWQLGGNSGTTPGTHFLGTADNQPLEFKVNGMRALRLEDNGDGSDINAGQDGAPNVIGGSPGNFVSAGVVGATIGGGGATNYGNVKMFTNSVGADYGTVGGGLANHIENDGIASTIAGGRYNIIGTNSDYSTIGGGYTNTIGADSRRATIAGGSANDIGTDSFAGSIGGGAGNTIAANTLGATIPGGSGNAANGDYCFAAGRRAKAIFPGTFVWADSQNADFFSGIADSISFRCQGGVRFTSGSGAANQTVSWIPGGAAWAFSSDRNLKEAVTAVDTRDVLDKVTRLPMNEWKFKGHSQRHIGPMAQDFHAQFPLNDNDKMIDSGDLHGVALAAIQGLNQKVEVRMQNAEVRNRRLEEEITDLKQRLAALESIIRNQKSN